jgi:cobalamin biosynthesis protein CbiD
MPLVNEGVRIELALRALSPVARKAIEDAVNRQLKMIKLDQAGGNPWLKKLL